MRIIFVNHTNHNSAQWSVEQRAAAEVYGQIIDLPFPPIPAEFGTEELSEIVSANLAKILELSPKAVLCQGEFVYTYLMVEQLKKHNILTLAACSERLATQNIEPDGTVKRVSIFQFVRFRNY